MNQIQQELDTWEGMGLPPSIPQLHAGPGWQEMSPAERITALNTVQMMSANRLRTDTPDTYADDVRDMETDFNKARGDAVTTALAEDVVRGNVSEETVGRYLKSGANGMDAEHANYFRTRYGEATDMAGPWQTVKQSVTGADGKPQGFAYVRHAPGTDRVEVSYDLGGKSGRIKGVEDVSAAEAYAGPRRAVTMRDQHDNSAGADTTFGPGPPLPDDIRNEADEFDATPEPARPYLYGLRAVESRLRGRSDIADQIGQGFWAGLPGQAAKGFLDLGAATIHGPGALFGNKESVENWRQGTADVAGSIEGQSRLGFEGGTWNNVLQGVSGEAIPLALSGGAGAVARIAQQAVASSLGRAFMGRMAALEMEEAGSTAILRGVGKVLGTSNLESAGARAVADRVSNAVAFLPSSARSGLQNISTTLEAAEAARASGDEAKALELEKNAVMNGWAGLGIELLSENMWLNEMLVTRAGRSFDNVATRVLADRMGKQGWQELQQRAKAALAAGIKGGAQEGVEEVAAGVGGRAWMNEFAAQNQDLLAGVEEEFLTGAVLGATLSGAKALAQDGRPAVLNELMERGLAGDAHAAALMEQVRQQAALLQNNQPGKPASPPAAGTDAAPAPVAPAPAASGGPGAAAPPSTVGTGVQGEPATGPSSLHATPGSGDITRLPGLLDALLPADTASSTSAGEAETLPYEESQNEPLQTPRMEPAPRAEDPAAAVAATPGTVTSPPVPDTVETVDEQARLAADKGSTRKAVLITPGTPKPGKVAGLKPLQTPHGLVLYNPKKITAEEVQTAAAGETFDARVLGFSESGAPAAPSATVVTASLPGAPNVQAELVPESQDSAGASPHQVQAAAAAAEAAAPGATVEVKPVAEVVDERAGSATSEQPAAAEATAEVALHKLSAKGRASTASTAMTRSDMEAVRKQLAGMKAVYVRLLDCLK